MIELNIDKRKLELNNTYNLGLSYWDLIFWQNNKIQANNEGELVEKIQNNAEDLLKKLYAIAESKEKFYIKSQGNKELDRYFYNKLSKQAENTSSIADENVKKEKLSKILGENQYKEYKNIVENMKKSNYPTSFKCLMLLETLTQTYRIDYHNNDTRLIVNKRKLGETILGMMNFPTVALEYIYNQAKNYTSFKNLYKDAQLEYRKMVCVNSEIDISDAETFNKGKWIKFSCLKEDEENFNKNVEKLTALVAETPWCTNAYASNHLTEGDFYVFVDNNGKPRIAVKMTGNELDEIRGLKNNSSQEIEDEYRDVAISFLKTNKDIKNGLHWLEKEEWNERLLQYRKDLQLGNIDKIDIDKLIKDLFFKDYKIHDGQANTNLNELIQELPKIKNEIATYLNIKPSEIYFGEYNPSKKEECPYKVIFGDVVFENIKKADNLMYIFGNADLYNSKILDLPNLKFIANDVYFENSKILSLPNLETIGGCAFFGNSQLNNLPNLKYIVNDAEFYNSKLRTLPSLISIGGDVDFKNSNLESLPQLKEINGDADFRDTIIADLQNLTTIGKNAYFSNSIVQDLSKLTFVGGNANFRQCAVQDLSSLHTIGANGYFSNCNIKSLKNLTYVNGNLNLKYSNIENIEKLHHATKVTIEKSKLSLLKNLVFAKTIALDEEEISFDCFKQLIKNQKAIINQSDDFTL